MDSIRKYGQKNRKRMLDVFKSMGKHDKIEATKVFNYMQNSFDPQQIRFEMNGRNFFDDDQNSTQMEKLLEAYYRLHQGDESKKFYLYRIEFTLDEVFDILQFWLEREPGLKIVTPGNEMSISEQPLMTNQQIKKQKLPNEQKHEKEVPVEADQQQNNEFDVDDQSLPQTITQYQLKIQQYDSELQSAESEPQKQRLQNLIKQMKMKIKVLEQRLKATSPQNTKKKIKPDVEPIENSVRTESPSTKSMKKVNINYKAIFEFYAKQTHLTGVKATFERIEHESQRINYQKLVHFLRQYNLLPSDVASRKKVHGLYIKHSQATRDLKLQGFLNVLDGVVDILQPNKSKQERQQILKMKIYEKDSKNNKILNHPFHSLQKQDFRINVNELNYNFKLKPQDGKFVHEVNNSIQKRRQDKQEAKTERSKQKQLKQIRYLKKLQSIDPFSELLLKNNKVLQEKTQQCEPIASLDNMEKYRDHSFNFQGHFGIDLSSEANHESPRKNSHKQLGRQYSQRYRKGQETQKKVERLQREETAKMEILMSGIVERSNAKMQKLGISPTKMEKSVKFS